MAIGCLSIPFVILLVLLMVAWTLLLKLLNAILPGKVVPGDLPGGWHSRPRSTSLSWWPFLLLRGIHSWVYHQPWNMFDWEPVKASVGKITLPRFHEIKLNLVAIMPDDRLEALLVQVGSGTVDVLHIDSWPAPTDRAVTCFTKIARAVDLSFPGFPGNELTDAQLQPWHRCTNLATLIIGQQNQVTDRGLTSFTGLTSLTRLEIVPATHLTDAVFAVAATLPNLQHLKLENAKQITDQGLYQLKGHPKLCTLHLPGCMIADLGLFALVPPNLPRLLELGLSRNGITDACLIHLATHTTLTMVRMDSCPGITPVGAAALRSVLPRCEIYSTN